VSSFTFDTSGVVGPIKLPERTHTLNVGWNDLSPFAQGYVEAAMREFVEQQRLSKPGFWVGFRHIHPEALATILRDCEAWLTEYTERSAATIPSMPEVGREFWRIRQEGKRRTFPPLTITLGDDGKVCLAPTTQDGGA